MTSTPDSLRAVLRESLLASGWGLQEVGETDSLIELGLDSLALALWVSEIERTLKMKIPFARLTLEQWDTLQKAADIVGPELKNQGLKDHSK